MLWYLLAAALVVLVCQCAMVLTGQLVGQVQADA